MPEYKYRCPFCSTEYVRHSLISEHKARIKCGQCGAFAEQVFDAVTLRTDIKPFVTDHITGDPVVVGSRRERDEFLSRHGLYEGG